MVCGVNIPRDVLHGETLINMSGNTEMRIENYKGIHLYTSQQIIVVCKKMTLCIDGEHLHICYFSGCDMKITGVFHTITYVSNGELCC